MSIVTDGLIVEFEYTLKDSEGEILDSSDDEGPLEVLMGGENIVPGLEAELLKHQLGDSFDVVVPAKEGYGLQKADATRELPRDTFPDDVPLEEGMEIHAETDEGMVFPMWVLEVHDEVVLIDLNHPLAGVDLHFAIKVTGIREPSPEEVEHGHPHGPDGHQD